MPLAVLQPLWCSGCHARKVSELYLALRGLETFSASFWWSFTYSLWPSNLRPLAEDGDTPITFRLVALRSAWTCIVLLHQWLPLILNITKAMWLSISRSIWDPFINHDHCDLQAFTVTARQSDCPLQNNPNFNGKSPACWYAKCMNLGNLA